MQNIWQDMLNIIKAPIAGNLDLKQLFLLTGAVLVIIAAWLMIFHYIRMARTELT